MGPERCPGSDVLTDPSWRGGGLIVCVVCGEDVDAYWDGVQWRKRPHNRSGVECA